MVAAPEYTPLDEVDRKILQLLQRDARNQTAVEIAEQIGVSDGTVRNRIDNLEEQGIIEGYTPTINYEKAGYQLEVLITCTARIVDRDQFAREALQIEGVIEIHEMMTGRGNIKVRVVAPRHDELTRIAKSLDAIGLNVESEELVRHHYLRPFNHFGATDVTEAEEGPPEDDEATHDF